METPLIIARKGANLPSDNDPEKEQRDISYKDICPTIAALMSIGPPKQNEGFPIEEILDLNNMSELEKKLYYLSLRQNIRDIKLKEAGCI